MPQRLTRLTLRGFKSIRSLDAFALGDLTVLVGANGSGKSNLISFFRAVSCAVSRAHGLQDHLAATGRAHSWLHDGPSTTTQVEAEFEIETLEGRRFYDFVWKYAVTDSLYFSCERVRIAPAGAARDISPLDLGTGHTEAQLAEHAEGDEAVFGAIRALLGGIAVYQFHNTSITSRMRQAWDVTDGRHLKEDGGNLAAFLLGLRSESDTKRIYERIVRAIRSSLPFFDDFVLEPSDRMVLLQWRERDCDRVFGAHQASDGMLRYMALVALLLQPEKDMPSLLVLDEPELGLHPFAITAVVGLIKAVSRRTQVILATQSAPLVNEFTPEDIVTVERHGRESVFRRQSTAELHEWLETYTLAELWEKNVIGGRP